MFLPTDSMVGVLRMVQVVALKSAAVPIVTARCRYTAVVKNRCKRRRGLSAKKYMKLKNMWTIQNRTTIIHCCVRALFNAANDSPEERCSNIVYRTVYIYIMSLIIALLCSSTERACTVADEVCEKYSLQCESIIIFLSL